MRRLGALLIIIGANLIVGGIGLAFYRAYFECVSIGCADGAMESYFELMTSSGGVVYWVAIIAGVATLWRGKKMRTGAAGD